MRILISNDDGVFAPGISILAKTLSTIASVTVIAPDRNRSGASHSLTLSRPLHVMLADNGYYSVDGTPTDCVHLALTGYFEHAFDLVVSGLNQGANLGEDVLYSGTVAAAMEGRDLGLPAIAVSMMGRQVQHYETGAAITKQLVLKLKQYRLPAKTILNVNVPDVPLEKIRGIQVTRLGKHHPSEPVLKMHDPRGQLIYWIGPSAKTAQDGEAGTDFHAVEQGFVSVTPLKIDMTYHEILDEFTAWMG